MDQQVVDNQQARRFEIYNVDELAGFAEYHLHGNQIALLHTEIAARFEGRGLGGKLVRQMLDDARHRGRAVLPYCPSPAGGSPSTRTTSTWFPRQNESTSTCEPTGRPVL